MGRQAQAGAGALYRYCRGEVVKLLGGLTIPNSLCFSADGRTAYFADSPTARILSWALDGEGWPIGRPRPFADLTETGGSPDGSIMDRENGLWNAQWGASRLVRYRQDGSIDRAVSLPVSQPSCPAFGGMGLDALFVTTAREGMDSASTDTQAHDSLRFDCFHHRPWRFGTRDARDAAGCGGFSRKAGRR